ncbi:MAG: hypothetical protein IT464_07200 [Planctomycetes bacterium]|nr:hypothetical protein [Planctomycetota bacterium]
MRTVLSLAVLTLLFLPARAQERPAVKFENVEVSGITLDADGKPLAGISVADMWNYDGKWSANGGAKSDAEGKFTLTVRTFPDQPQRSYRIQAGDADSKLGAVAIVKADALKNLKFTLQPLVTVKGTLMGEEGFEPEAGGYVNVYWKAPPVWLCSTRLTTQSAKPDEKAVGQVVFELLLPVGEYSTLISAGEAFQYARPAISTLAGTAVTLDVPLKITALAKHYGKKAPAINVDFVRNLPSDIVGKRAARKGDPEPVTLDTFKGRWVLLEFWGFW